MTLKRRIEALEQADGGGTIAAVLILDEHHAQFDMVVVLRRGGNEEMSLNEFVYRYPTGHIGKRLSRAMWEAI